MYSRSWISLASPFPRFLIWGCLWSDPNALDPGIPKRGSNQRHCLGWTVQNSSHHYHHRVGPGRSNHDNPLLSVLPSSVSPTHPFKSDWLVSHPNNKKIIKDSLYFDLRTFCLWLWNGSLFCFKISPFSFRLFSLKPIGPVWRVASLFLRVVAAPSEAPRPAQSLPLLLHIHLHLPLLLQHPLPHLQEHLTPPSCGFEAQAICIWKERLSECTYRTTPPRPRQQCHHHPMTEN